MHISTGVTAYQRLSADICCSSAIVVMQQALCHGQLHMQMVLKRAAITCTLLATVKCPQLPSDVPRCT